jgi:hypothetical protein
VIPIAPFAAEIQCGREWIPCEVVGIVGDDEAPRFIIMFDDDRGLTSLMRVSEVRRPLPSVEPFG